MVWLSFAMKSQAPRFFGYGLLALVAIKLLSFDTLISVSDDDPVLNVRFLAFSMSIAALYLCAFAVWRNDGRLIEYERRAWSVYPILIVAANFLTLWIFTAEVMDFFDRRFVTVGWALYGALLVWMSFVINIPSVRIFAYGVFAFIGR